MIKIKLDSLENKTIASILSSYFLQVADKILQVIISLVLVRALYPQDFGLFAVLFALFNIFIVLIPAGQGPLFIRKKEYRAWELMEVICINALLCTIALELIADVFYYLNPDIPRMVRLFFIALLPGSINMAFISIASKELENYKLILPTLLQTISYGIFAAIFAFAGFRVYSFIYATLISTSVYTLICAVIFKKSISIKKLLALKEYVTYLKEGLPFNILYTLGIVSANIDRIILTKFSNMVSIGAYSVAANSLGKVSNFFTASIESVVYPLYSRLTGNIEKIRQIYHNFTIIMFAILIPLNTFIFVFAEDIVLFIGKEKWLVAVPFIRAFSFLYLINIFCSFGYQLLWVQKKERYTIYQQLIRLLALVAIGPALAHFYGIYAFVILFFILNFCELIYYYILLRPLREQIYKNIIFVLKFFLPVFILMNAVNKFLNFHFGIIFLIASYLFIGYFIILPFFKKLYGFKIDEL